MRMIEKGRTNIDNGNEIRWNCELPTFAFGVHAKRAIFLPGPLQMKASKEEEPGKARKGKRHVVLQDHQLRPLKTILSQPKQKGIVAYHSMGSGKTITAIVFAKNLGKPVVLLSPKYLHTVWRDEIVRVAGPMSKIQYHDVHMIATLRKTVSLANKILVIDEAQHLVIQLRAMTAKDALETLNWLRSCHRVILLTGTPVYEDEASLTWLVNIAAGRAVVPYRISEIHQLYDESKWIRAALNGWIFPITISNWYIIFLQYSGVLMPTVRAMASSQKNWATLVNEADKTNANLSPEERAKLDEVTAKIQRISDYKDEPDWFVKLLMMITQPISSFILQRVFRVEKEYTSGDTLEIMKRWADKRDDEKRALVNQMQNAIRMGSPQEEVDRLQQEINDVAKDSLQKLVEAVITQDRTARFATMSWTLGFLYAIARLFYDTQDVSDVRRINSKKLASVILPYMSYFDWEKDRGKFSDYDANYPKKTFELKSVGYTKDQMELWIDYTYGRLSEDTIAHRLRAFASAEEAKIRGDDVYKPETYQHLGLSIGNLPSLTGMPSPKFKEMLDTMTLNQAASPCSYRTYVKTRTYHGRTLWPTVVYSQFFENGILLFSDYLEANKVPHGILTPNMSGAMKRNVLNSFRRGKISVILLHPEVTEGVSILGGQLVLIMEPILLKAKRDQVIARPVRYKALNHLPVEQRFVRIVEFCSTVKKPGIWLLTVYYILRRWIQWSADVVVGRRFHLFDQTNVPDELVMKRQGQLELFQSQLTDYLHRYDVGKNIEKEGRKMECCIWNPGDPKACTEKDTKCGTLLE